MTDAREKALAEWLSQRVYDEPDETIFRAGYDAGAAEVDALRARLGAIRVACESVNGRYVHPDQLDTAVARALDLIRALLSSAPTPVAETEAKP